MEKLQLNACAGRSVSTRHPSNTFKIVAFLWFALFITNVKPVGGEVVHNVCQLANMGLLIYLVVIMTKTRMAFRSKYIIPGNCCTDCLVSYFCACCSSLQMYRHMKRSGDPPARFATFTGVETETLRGVEAEIV